jgi:hypothetical protein
MSAPFSDSHSLIDISVSVKRRALSLSPAWAVVAGALAAGVGPDARSLLNGLVLIFLVDPLWGSLWQIIMDWPGKVEKVARRPFWKGWHLPYREPGSPAEAVARSASGLQLAEAYKTGAVESLTVALALTVIVALALGKLAVVATGAVFVLSTIAACVRKSRIGVALLSGLVFFAAPFYLASYTLGHPSYLALALGLVWIPVYVASVNCSCVGSKRLLLIVPTVLAGAYFLWATHAFGAVLVLLSAIPVVASPDGDERMPFFLLLQLLLTSAVVGYAV